MPGQNDDRTLEDFSSHLHPGVEHPSSLFLVLRLRTAACVAMESVSMQQQRNRPVHVLFVQLVWLVLFAFVIIVISTFILKAGFGRYPAKSSQNCSQLNSNRFRIARPNQDSIVPTSDPPATISNDGSFCVRNVARETWINTTYVKLTSGQPPLTSEKKERWRNLTCSHRSSSFFQVVDANNVFHRGGYLTVSVFMRDAHGKPKLRGGDFIVGRLFNSKLGAAVSASVHDVGNGSYQLSFPLLWTGNATIAVRLLHSREAVNALNYVRENFPEKIAFQAVFRETPESPETTSCYMTSVENLNLSNISGVVADAEGDGNICNLTDSKLCEPWLCIKPNTSLCKSLQHLHSYNYEAIPWGDEYQELFESEKAQEPLKANGQSQIVVESNDRVIPSQPRCEPVMSLQPSGHYFRNEWNPLGYTLKRFSRRDVIACLRGRQVLFFGDSTIVQWWNHLTAMVPTFKKIDLHIQEIHRPFHAIDTYNKITMRYFPHAYPFICAKLQRAVDFTPCANAIDNLRGGHDTVVALALGPHFTPFPLRVFLARIFNIREAVIRLLKRSPKTAVVIRLVSTRELILDYSRFSNWFLFKFNEALRAAFQDIKGVAFVDAWDMTASVDSYQLHPNSVIVSNQVNVFLNHICKQG
ncbi:NXPE family member 3-like isoform X1 [Lethenteron reissneri]|uniref:NXPE family member 3-like isoform X1 n=2 Tax=Lethenteron reissneri TaxID=7753 RepID=UPI002AB616F5|nr:NXPE family member 3-like isoform X1 [Lethenteron reissneri]